MVVIQAILTFRLIILKKEEPAVDEETTSVGTSKTTDKEAVTESEPQEGIPAEEQEVADEEKSLHVSEPRVEGAALAADFEEKEERILNVEETEDEVKEEAPDGEEVSVKTSGNDDDDDETPVEEFGITRDL